MSHPERPLSPFMLGQTYRIQLTSLMSLLHRTSGVILVAGAIGLAWWLMAAAQGGESWARASECLASPLGMVALAGFSLALVYHLLNGIRHLMWDMGHGMSIPEVYRSGYVVAGLTVVLTAVIWFFAMRGGA